MRVLPSIRACLILRRYTQGVSVQIAKLVKIGDRENILKLVDDGEIFIRRVLSFRGIERKEIGDNNENLLINYQAEKVEGSWAGIEFDTASGLTGQVKITDLSKNPYSYCMYAITPSGLETHQLIDEKCKDFGDAALFITDVQKFLNRIKNACREKGIGCESKLVDYLDFNSHHGEVGPFVKDHVNFSHQKEFRILFNIPDGEEIARIYIGSLHDISIVSSIDEINHNLALIYNADCV